MSEVMAYRFATNMHPLAYLTEEDYLTPNLEASENELCPDDLKIIETELKELASHVSVKRLINESPNDSLAFTFDDGSILVWSPGWQDSCSETEIFTGYVPGDDVEEFIQRERDELLEEIYG